MPRQLHHLGLAGLLCLSFGATLGAVTPNLPFAFKLRMGMQAGSAKDALTRRTLGFGLEAGMVRGPNRFALELGWSYKPGDQFKVDPSTIPVAPGRVLQPGNGVDVRKNELKGLAARCSWQRDLGPMALQVGIQAGGSQYRQEYIGDLQGTTAADPTKVVFRDTYNGVLTKGGITLSPYAGLAWSLDAISSLEISVLALRYRAVSYSHQAGYANGTNNNVTKDSIVGANRMIPHLELTYVVRF